MGTEKANPNSELGVLFAQLADPFDPSEIKWRVTHANRDGSRGAVIAYADPRAYTDRLNQLVTPTGWTRTYAISTVSPVSRVKKDKVIQTAKVLATCTLSIDRVGCHSDSGEEWADEQNAMTSAVAQAFKRAAACFGLGRYLYDLRETWVPLDGSGQPLSLPSLPKWALPGASAANSSRGRSAEVQRGPIDQNVTARIEGSRRILGDPIYREILWRVARVRTAGAIPNAQLQQGVADIAERAARGIQKVNLLAQQIGDTELVSILDHLQIASMAQLPNLDSLKQLAVELERRVAPAA